MDQNNEYEMVEMLQDDEANEKTNDLVKLYMKDIGRFPLLSAEEERELAARKMQGDLDAEHWLVVSNLRLVVSIAKHYYGRGLPLLDLIQEGSIGLMRAVQKYDYTKGTRLSTYASVSIKLYIKRALANKSRILYLPVHVKEDIDKICRIQQELVLELEHDPSEEEIAEASGLSLERVHQLMPFIDDAVSLEKKLYDDNDSCMEDLVADDKIVSPEALVIQEMLHEQLMELLDQLKPGERKILKLYYGLYNGKTHSLDEIGKMLGMSRESARNHKENALRKLKRMANRLYEEDEWRYSS